MGLDTYAYHADLSGMISEDKFKPSVLIGGMLSGTNNSFRGKMYDPYIYSVTGQTLYQETILPDVVKRMAADLKDFVSTATLDEWENKGTISREEAIYLAEWFDVVAKENGTVINWW